MMDEHATNAGPSLDERTAHETQMLRAAEAHIERGEYVTLEAMMVWVDSVGMDHELPPQQPAVPFRPVVHCHAGSACRTRLWRT